LGDLIIITRLQSPRAVEKLLKRGHSFGRPLSEKVEMFQIEGSETQETEI
jgi:hypothetical protein